jgi:hypothetical protein
MDTQKSIIALFASNTALKTIASKVNREMGSYASVLALWRQSEKVEAKS